VAFSIDIPDLQPLLDLLSDVPELIMPALQDAAEAGLLSLIPQLASYPPALPGSRYRRTGNEGRLWTAARPEWQALPSGFEASIGNANPPGPFIQSEEFQSSIHRGRWTTDADAVRDHSVEINRYFERALQQVADKIDKG